MGKKLELFEPEPQHPPAKKVRPLTTGPCNHYAEGSLKLIASVEVFSMPFTMFELCGAVFIMNSKIHLRKNSSKPFRIISVFIQSPLD